jgi:flagella basal body P-ring formation protein FlgA
MVMGLCILLPIRAPGNDATPSLEEAVERFVLELAPRNGASVEVPRIPVSAAERRDLIASFSVHPRQRISGSVPVRIALSKDRQLVRSVVVSVDVEAARDVLVAARPIRAGETLRSDAVVVEEMSGRRLPDDVVLDAASAIGLRARRSIAVGSLIRSSRLETSTVVRRGQRVKLLFESGSLRIESIGRAREDGNVGDWIEAENLASRKTLTARVGADGALHVEH